MIRNDGRVWCWGYNEFGALGDGSVEDRLSPVQTLMTAAREVAAGAHLRGQARRFGLVLGVQRLRRRRKRSDRRCGQRPGA